VQLEALRQNAISVVSADGQKYISNTGSGAYGVLVKYHRPMAQASCRPYERDLRFAATQDNKMVDLVSHQVRPLSLASCLPAVLVAYAPAKT